MLLVKILLEIVLLVCARSSVCGLGPVAALAGVPIDEARLAALQVCVSLDAVEVCGLVSQVLIQAIGAATAEVCNGVQGGGGGFGGGGLWGEACIFTCRENKDQ